MSTTADPNIIKLRNVRLSFPKLFVPEAVEEGGKLKYSAAFILDNTDHAQIIALIEKATERVALDEFRKKVPLRHKPLRDGNEFPDMDGYGNGVMFVSAKSDRRPVVVDSDSTPLTADDQRPYAGCYVHANIRLFAYDHKTGGKGVSAELRAVMFAKDGDSFGAGPVNADDEFNDVMADDMLN